MRERGVPKVYEMMDFRVAKQRREEMLLEVEMNRLAKALRASRKRRAAVDAANRTSALTWELKRVAGCLLTGR